MGRKKTPTKIVKLTGNPGKRKINQDEPCPPESVPSKPRQVLSKEGSKEWDRIVPHLEALGLLSQIDYAALLGYCQSFGRWVAAERKLRRNGDIIHSPKGMPMTSPYVTQANQALTLLHKFMSEFGLSPSSRASVTTAKKKEDDPLEQFLNG